MSVLVLWGLCSAIMSPSGNGKQFTFESFDIYRHILCTRLILDLDDLRLQCLLLQSYRRFEGAYCPHLRINSPPAWGRLHYVTP